MKFDGPIEVSGIQRIVINRKLVFVKTSESLWALLSTDGKFPDPDSESWFRSDEEMSRTVQKLLGKLKPSKKYKGCFTWVNRAWVHEDTLNIVRRDAE